MVKSKNKSGVFLHPQAGLLSRAGWIRQQVLINPSITHSELLENFDKSGRDPTDRPNATQLLSTAKGILCERYGLENLEAIPRTAGGQFNMSGMIRCWLKKHPQGTFEEAKNFFAADGLDLNEAIFSYAKRHMPGQPRASSESESPDANQASGPRARFGKRQQRRTHKEKVTDKFGGVLGVLKTVNEFSKTHGGVDKTAQIVRELQAVADKVGGWTELVCALETLKSLKS